MRASHFTAFAAAVAAIGLVTAAVLADDPTNPTSPNPPIQNQTQPAQTAPYHPLNTAGAAGSERALVIKSLPTKKLVGSSVVNPQGEKLGTIDDLVIDLETGKVTYAALSVGGVLGIGDKLFAVPYEEFKTSHDSSNNISFVLDVSKDRLAAAPGFDKDHWPDFASRDWRTQIDNYYHRSSASRTSTDTTPQEKR